MKFNLIIDKTQDEEIVVRVHERSEFTDRLEELIAEFDRAGRIAAYNDEEIKLLDFSDIECITVIDGKTYVIDRCGSRLKVKKRLYELESLLPSYFIRINKSSLANEKRLEKFTTSFSGAVDAVFKCGYVEYVSRRCFAEIKRRFDSK